MSLILSLETSTKTCSVAIQKDSHLLVCLDLFVNQSHSTMLNPLIEQALRFCGLALKDLDAIAIAKGPGSYTGLRIGAATAKGLCYALDKPLLAVNTLEAMAKQLSKTQVKEYFYCPMIDARRMEVYCAIFDAALNEIVPTQAKIIDETSFGDLMFDKQVLYFGDGANKCKSFLEQNPHFVFLDNFQPKAEAVGMIALNLFEKQTFEDIAYFEPFYLKDFVGTKVNQSS